MRKNRFIKAGAEYHVTAKANQGVYLMQSNLAKKLFLTIIRRAKEIFAFKFRQFTIMDNHVHLLIRPNGPDSLSRIMQWILSVFARTYNKIMQRRGHVWNDRFHSRTVETKQEFRKVFCYISNNPVRAQMVRSIFDYEYCGIAAYRNREYDLVDPPDQQLLLMFPYLAGKV